MFTLVKHVDQFILDRLMQPVCNWFARMFGWSHWKLESAASLSSLVIILLILRYMELPGFFVWFLWLSALLSLLMTIGGFLRAYGSRLNAAPWSIELIVWCRFGYLLCLPVFLFFPSLDSLLLALGVLSVIAGSYFHVCEDKESPTITGWYTFRRELANFFRALAAAIEPG